MVAAIKLIKHGLVMNKSDKMHIHFLIRGGCRRLALIRKAGMDISQTVTRLQMVCSFRGCHRLGGCGKGMEE